MKGLAPGQGQGTWGMRSGGGRVVVRAPGSGGEAPHARPESTSRDVQSSEQEISYEIDVPRNRFFLTPQPKGTFVPLAAFEGALPLGSAFGIGTFGALGSTMGALVARPA